MSSPGPLADVRVIDLAIARAGPTCVRALADLGADVIQVWHPHHGDLSGSDSLNLHRNKRSILLDLKVDGGREVLLDLVGGADVLVENFRPGVKQRLDIAYETLAAVNPRLIYASLSGYGQDGPHAERPCLDQIAQGVGGLMSVTGPPGSGPWRAGIAVSDVAAGHLLAQGVLAALYARERSGRGQWVQTSLLEAMIAFMDFQAARWLIDGEVPGQAGNDHPTVAPMGTYRTADGWLNLAPSLGWERFAGAIGAPGLVNDPRFADAASRARNREALRTEIEACLGRRPTADWVESINAAGTPCGPVLSMDEVFADPQVEHLGMAAPVEHPEAGALRVVRHPVGLSETPASVRRAAPAPGGDTRAVLRELGYSQARIEALLEQGATAERSGAGGWGRR